jgi:hypothetical protein
MTWLPGWNSIEGSARWGDIFFWTGSAFLLLLASCIVLSKLYGWRRDALIVRRDQLIAIAQDLQSQTESPQPKDPARLQAALPQQPLALQPPPQPLQPAPLQQPSLQQPSLTQPPVTQPTVAQPRATTTPRPSSAPPAAGVAPEGAEKAPPEAEPPERLPDRVARVQERSPRGLTDSQKKSMVGTLAAFRGQKFSVVCIAGDEEGRSFADALVGMLRSAG